MIQPLSVMETAAPDISLSSTSGFTIELADCVESVGIGLVSTERAKRLLPPAFKLPDGNQPVTPLVVLAVRSQQISVAGAEPHGGVLAQIGLVIAPPDGTGEINLFTLWHFTTHSLLARRLNRIGLPSQYVPTIEYEVALGGKAGSTHISVPAPAQPAFRVTGAISEPNQSISFVGNWWGQADQGLLKLNSTVPTALVVEAQLTLTTAADSRLGHLIGGDRLDFAVLQRFNTFQLARIEVSLVTP